MDEDNATIESIDEETGEVRAFDAANLVGDVRDFLLRGVRENGMKTPWDKMTESQQTLEIERATDRALRLVTDCVDIVAQGNFDVIHALIDNFKIKDGEVTVTAKGIADDKALLMLNHAGKKRVKIIVADESQFDQSRSNIEADPDQPEIPGTEEPDTTGEPDDDEQAEGEAALEAMAPKTKAARGRKPTKQPAEGFETTY